MAVKMCPFPIIWRVPKVRELEPLPLPKHEMPILKPDFSFEEIDIRKVDAEELLNDYWKTVKDLENENIELREEFTAYKSRNKEFEKYEKWKKENIKNESNFNKF
jgi:hypothetical protein